MAKARQQQSDREDRPEGQYKGSLCAGHLLVWTWRKFVAGHGDCPVLVREYEGIAGEQAGALLAAFAIFLRTLGVGSRRVLAVGQPHCAGLTPDEQQILRLIAAAQAGQKMLMEAHLCWLVRDGQRRGVARAARTLAGLLAANGVILPEVRHVPPPATPMLEVLH